METLAFFPVEIQIKHPWSLSAGAKHEALQDPKVPSELHIRQMFFRLTLQRYLVLFGVYS